MARAIVVVLITGLTSGAMLAQSATVTVIPGQQRILPDSVGQVRIRVDSVLHLHAYHIQVSYDPHVLRCRGVAFLGFLGSSTFTSSLLDTVNGTATMDEAILGPGGQSGSGDLVLLRFLGVAEGTSVLSMTETDFRDTTNHTITVTTHDGSIRVGPPDGVRENGRGSRGQLRLESYPNPFNPSMTLRYSVEEGGESAIRIYTLLGKEVYSITRMDAPHSVQEFRWRGNDRYNVSLPSGAYVVQLCRSQGVALTKVVLLR